MKRDVYLGAKFFEIILQMEGDNRDQTRDSFCRSNF
jgi:hypothetical protein